MSRTNGRTVLSRSSLRRRFTPDNPWRSFVGRLMLAFGVLAAFVGALLSLGHGR